MSQLTRHLSRRIIRALRVGVVSEESVSAVSVGTAPFLERLAAFLDGGALVSQRTLLVPGDWGFGKSHLRMLCNALLVNRELPVIRATIDGKASSLAHLHRCVPRWLDTIQFKDIYGLRRSFERGVIDRRHAQHWCSRSHQLFSIALSMALGDSEAGWFLTLGRHLSSPDYSYQHPKATELLLSVAHLLNAVGPGTLVLLLDEAENIDKQHDVRGRKKSYATLGRFQECVGMRIVLFVTPRFEAQTRDDFTRGTAERWVGWPEPARLFLHNLSQLPRICLPALDDTLARQLIRRIVEVYESAYGVGVAKVDDASLVRLWGKTATRSVRLLVRMTVSQLDRQRLRGRLELKTG